MPNINALMKTQVIRVLGANKALQVGMNKDTTSRNGGQIHFISFLQ